MASPEVESIMQKNQGIRYVALSAALVLTSTLGHTATPYKFTRLGALGGSHSAGAAVNKAGIVVGEASQPPNGDDPPLEPNRPAKWGGLSATDLGTLGGPYGYASGINNSGVIVGYTWLANGAGVHATLWNGNAMSDLGTLGGSYSYAFAINKAGVVVGSASTPGNAVDRAAIWKNGRLKALKDLGGKYHRAVAISNNGYIAGMSSDVGGTHHAVVWKDATLTDLGADRYVFGVNSSGHAVGYSPWGNAVGATSWVGTTPTLLGCLANGFQCIANAINDDGVVVGESRIDDGNDNHAAMWVGDKVIDLNDRLDQATRDAGWVLVDARAISGSGFITGMARNTVTGESSAYLLSR